MSKRTTINTTALTEGVEALRNNRTSARLVDNGLPVDPAGMTADVVAMLIRAGVPVHKARRRRANPEELFARLTGPAPDDNTFKGDAR